MQHTCETNIALYPSTCLVPRSKSKPIAMFCCLHDRRACPAGVGRFLASNLHRSLDLCDMQSTRVRRYACK